MGSRWLYLNEKYSVISHREKVVIFITGLLAISYLMAWFIILPLQTNYFNLQKQIKNFKQQEVSSLNQLEDVQQALGRDYSNKLIKQEQAIQNKIKHINQQLKSINLSFVAPNKMPIVLQQLLHKNEKIKLINFKVHQAVPVNLQSENKQKKSNHKKNKFPSQHIKFYEHTMSLQIKGDYFSLLDYLKKVQKIKEKLFLKSVDYQVEKYPQGKLTLTISTVSSDNEFIEL